MNYDDQRLIAECLAGRQEAYRRLMERHQDRLYTMILQLVPHTTDADDVLQETFINAFQSLASFKGDAEFYTWLFRIAYNVTVSLRRKRRPAFSLDAARATDEIAEPIDTSEETRPEASLERSEADERVRTLLARLSEEHRLVLLLKDIDGMKYDEMADLLQIPIGTVRSRLSRARLELRTLITASEKSGTPGITRGAAEPSAHEKRRRVAP